MSEPSEPVEYPTRDTVVIGGSAGAVDALRGLLSRLPADFPAAVLAVVHRAPVEGNGTGWGLSRAGPLPVRDAVDGEPLRRGEVLVAPADRHLHVEGDHVRVVRGPHENRSRPAIDPLFRSAAVSRTTRVVAVLLSGMLDDGTAGVGAVKKCGGMVLVQDPSDAEYPEMPETALRYWKVDHVAAADDLADFLLSAVRSVAPPPHAVPQDMRAEASASLDGSDLPADHEQQLVTETCPDCGGPLSLLRLEEFRQFRCQVGHTFTDRVLLSAQRDAIERSLWIAVRSFEERARTLESLAQEEERGGGVRAALSRTRRERATESWGHAALIRGLLTDKEIGA